jgi:hypothetical protein
MGGEIMTDSILDSTKKILGLDAGYTAFDLDVITHINSALAALNQLGIGPESGFMITDSTSTWDEVLGTTSNYNLAKSYVYLRVRILFDPPNTSFVLTALSDQLRELEWRLSVEREATGWVNPNLDVDLEEETVLDGGAV